MIRSSNILVKDIGDEFGRTRLRINELSCILSKEAIFNASEGQGIITRFVVIDNDRRIPIVVMIAVEFEGWVRIS